MAESNRAVDTNVMAADNCERKPLSVWKERVATTRQQIMQDDNSPSEEWVESLVTLQYDEAVQNLAYFLAQTDSSKEQILSVRNLLRFLLITLGVPSEGYRTTLRMALCRQPSLLDLLGQVVLVWLDFLLAATDRSALAALVACWYNALQAVEIPPIQDMMDSTLFIANLLRQLLPSSAVLSPQRDSQQPDSVGGDEATEWITLLLCFFCQKGSLGTLYQAATGASTDSQTLEHSILSNVFPEQVLLLQVLISQMDTESKTGEASSTLLGDHWDRLQSNVLFLARDLYPSIRLALLYSKDKSDSESNSCRQETNESLGPTALSLVRELLADALAHQSSQSKELRYILGKEEHLVATWIQDLGHYYDKVQERFRGRPAKDVVLTQEEQRIFVSLVRLIGNLCHQSQINQNHLRKISVPLLDQKDNDQALVRTGLHLLLSCTSLSHTCFTLREWSVVAIRNALDENVENQALVAELQAQEPAPSSPLDEMGVRVQLEKSGKVSLKPIQENK
eukprot:scaffold2142_cov165-Amphora_coffeaeformis.AAC.3